MIPILSSAAASVLEEVARARTLLAFDFDGTLAPIVADRTAAAMRTRTLALLRTTALLYPCVVVSGRTRADVAARVAAVPLAAVVGNHGAEPGLGPIDRHLQELVVTWRPRLNDLLETIEGLDLEDKRLSMALHYRGSSSPEAAERAILDAVRELEGARAFRGHAVINVVPVDAPTKGDAMRAVCARLDVPRALYVGDDNTDEEAFGSEVVSVSVHVGEGRASRARFSLATQEDIDGLLRALVVARARQVGLGDRWEGLVRAVKP